MSTEGGKVTLKQALARFFPDLKLTKLEYSFIHYKWMERSKDKKAVKLEKASPCLRASVEELARMHRREEMAYYKALVEGIERQLQILVKSHRKHHEIMRNIDALVERAREADFTDYSPMEEEKEFNILDSSGSIDFSDEEREEERPTKRRRYRMPPRQTQRDASGASDVGE